MTMKRTIIISLVFLRAFLVMSQTDNIPNSFEETYRKTNPTINYFYDENKQIHNYSNNWDFDNDGINDEVCFIGTGGAHLYYFLRVILSSDQIVRDFPYLESDFPILPFGEELTKSDFNPQKTCFAVLDVDKNNSNAIFIRLDDISFFVSKKILKRQGVKTNLIVLTFKNGKAILNDFGKKR